MALEESRHSSRRRLIRPHRGLRRMLTIFVEVRQDVELGNWSSSASPAAAGFETMALYWDKERVAQMGRDIGFEPAPSYMSESVDDCIAEMDEAGIGVAVVTGRLSGQRLGQRRGSHSRSAAAALRSPVASPPWRMIHLVPWSYSYPGHRHHQIRRLAPPRLIAQRLRAYPRYSPDGYRSPTIV